MGRGCSMKMRPPVRIALAACAVAFLSSCGGSSPSAPTATPSTPAQSVRTVLGNPSFTISGGTATFKSIDNPPLGTMDATAEWGNAANPIDFYATDGRCPGFVDLQAGRCTVLARAE